MNTTSAPLAAAFDPAAWSAVAGPALTAAGAESLLVTRPTAISLEWPVVPSMRRVDDDGDDREVDLVSIEIQQQEGTLIVVSLFGWYASVTPTTRQLAQLIKQELCHKSHRDDKGFIELNWKHNDDERVAAFVLDDYVYADTPDWLDRLIASARRFEQIFRALEPLMQQAVGGVFEAGAAHVVVQALAERLSSVPATERAGA